ASCFTRGAKTHPRNLKKVRRGRRPTTTPRERGEEIAPVGPGGRASARRFRAGLAVRADPRSHPQLSSTAAPIRVGPKNGMAKSAVGGGKMPTQQEINELKDQVATSCRIIGNRGLTRGSFGHVSARIPGTDRVLIKAKGPDEEAVEFATARDVITLDIEGAVIEAPQGLDAPNETAMHLAVYRKRPEVMSVIHSHPDWIVALTAAEREIVPMYGASDPGGMRIAVDGLPLYPKSVTIVNDELGEDFMQTMGEKDVCLLRGHGLTTAGRSVEECTSR